MQNLITFFCGLLFGLGLLLSGMTNPAKVQGFLDLAGAWDPSLGLVMGGAIAGAIGFFTVAKRRKAALLAHLPMNLPHRRDIDRRLVLGSLAFGAGWGLAGICPGPALVGLMTGEAGFLIFVLAMLAGMVAFDLIEQRNG